MAQNLENTIRLFATKTTKPVEQSKKSTMGKALDHQSTQNSWFMIFLLTVVFVSEYSKTNIGANFPQADCLIF